MGGDGSGGGSLHVKFRQSAQRVNASAQASKCACSESISHKNGLLPGVFSLMVEMIRVAHPQCKSRHQQEYIIVTSPRTALVCLLESSDGISLPLVFPSVAVHSGLRAPGVLGEWHGGGGVGVSARDGEVGVGTLKCVYVIDGVETFGRKGRKRSDDQKKRKDFS